VNRNDGHVTHQNTSWSLSGWSTGWNALDCAFESMGETGAEHGLRFGRKSIVSGEPVEADRRFRESLSFVPIAKLVAATRTLPHLLDQSNGFARRATILTFHNEFKGADCGRNLANEILATEFDGLLAYAVQGLQELLRDNEFCLPPSSIHEVQRYQVESDAVSLFMEERLEASPIEETNVAARYQAFTDFAVETSPKPCSRPEFGRRLSNSDKAMAGPTGASSSRTTRLRHRPSPWATSIRKLNDVI
jgi:putative DNA primase/helicase